MFDKSPRKSFLSSFSPLFLIFWTNPTRTYTLVKNICSHCDSEGMLVKDVLSIFKRSTLSKTWKSFRQFCFNQNLFKRLKKGSRTFKVKNRNLHDGFCEQLHKMSFLRANLKIIVEQSIWKSSLRIQTHSRCWR